MLTRGRLSGYADSVRFDTVVVIESLPDGELKTGRWLYEHVLMPRAAADPTLHVHLYQPHSLAELDAAMLDIAERLVASGHSPILHFETHGSPAGLQLADGSDVPWELLRPALTRVNEAVGLNLLVVLAACHGLYMCDVLEPVMPAPAWGIVGPMAPKSAGDLREAMSTFYSTLLSLLDVRKALAAMNQSHEVAEWEYDLMPAELMFSRILGYYLTVNLADEAELSERENRIVAASMRGHSFDIRDSMRIRAEVRQSLRDPDAAFERFRRLFFMLEQHPGNAARFTLSRQECEARARSAAA